MSFGPVWLMQPIPYFGEQLTGKWLFEPKIDGWRLQILHHAHGHTECWGRRLENKPNWSHKLPIVTKAAQMLPEGTLIDCELSSTGGRRFIPSLFAKKPKVKPIVYIFDVIFLANKNISKRMLKKRKQMLSELQLTQPLIPVIGQPLHNIKASMQEAIAHGHEGIVIKKLNSPYLIGKDAPIATENWRKVK